MIQLLSQCCALQLRPVYHQFNSLLDDWRSLSYWSPRLLMSQYFMHKHALFLHSEQRCGQTSAHSKMAGHQVIMGLGYLLQNNLLLHHFNLDSQRWLACFRNTRSGHTPGTLRVNHSFGIQVLHMCLSLMDIGDSGKEGMLSLASLSNTSNETYARKES